MPETISLWMTDSSILEWNGCAKLDVNVPRGRWPQVLAEALGDGLDEHYEGFVDHAVPVGGNQLAWREGGLDLEAEWALLFDRPLAQLDGAGPQTPCVAQGMIEGRWIAPLASQGAADWAAAVRGAGVLARGKGIAVTLGEVQAGVDSIAGAAVRVAAPLANGETHLLEARGADLAKIPVAGIVRAVADWCRENNQHDVRGVHLSLNGELNALALLPQRGRTALRRAFLPRLIASLIARHGDELAGLLDGARASLFRELSGRAEYLRPGSPAIMTVTDARGVVVGEGALLLNEAE